MILAVDTGGTKTIVARLTTDGLIDATIRFATPKDPEAYLDQLVAGLKELRQGHTIEMVVIAMPGTVKNSVVTWCGNLPWSDFAIGRELEGRLPDLTVYVENDANLAGLGEVHALHPMPRSMLYVTVSTGIGTGIISYGKIANSWRLSEGGWMLVEYGGEIQPWERFASGNAIHQIYGHFARDINDAKTWKEIADRISRGFLSIIPLLQPEVIVIGGSIGTYFDRYEKYLEALLDERLPGHFTKPQLLRATHPEEAVIYGCYYYARDHAAQ
jgi:glucokinase